VELARQVNALGDALDGADGGPVRTGSSALRDRNEVCDGAAWRQADATVAALTVAKEECSRLRDVNEQ
jgi:hypothetical protein